MPWAHIIDALQAAIFSLAHFSGGSLGLAVIALSLAIRLTLLPMTVRLARRALAHQRRLTALQPEVAQLRRRYANDPQAQWRETAALYEHRGVKPVDPANLIGGLVQAPILAALYAALRKGIGTGVRFLWVRDLSLPNLILGLIVAAVTVAGVALTPPADPARRVSVVQLALAAGVTIWLLTSTSALFALASGAGSVVNLVQAGLVRRTDRAEL